MAELVDALALGASERKIMEVRVLFPAPFDSKNFMKHNNQSQHDDFDNVEEKLKKERKSKKQYKVSGKSVFKLEKIIKDRSHETKS